MTSDEGDSETRGWKEASHQFGEEEEDRAERGACTVSQSVLLKSF